jgi:hypothetical protein
LRAGRILPMVLVLLPLTVILVAKPLKAKLLVQYPVEYKITGAWISEHLPPDALFLGRKPEIAYYAGRPMHPLPNEDLPRVIHYAKTHHINYMVIDDYSIASRPQLEFLLDNDMTPCELTCIFSAKAGNGRRIKVFQFKQ